MDDSNPDQRLYMRLAGSLREEIMKGLRAPGSKLPSITSLCRLHNLSRRTGGHAMQILENEGLVYREPGLGYYVAVRMDHNK